MRECRKFCQRGSNFDGFLVDERSQIPRTKAFRWRADEYWLGSVVIFQSFSVNPDQYCKEALYFCDFSGWSGPPVPLPSGSAHAAHVILVHTCITYT